MTALEVIDVARRHGMIWGENPTGLAAAALYTASVMENEDVTQEEIANAAGTSSVTLRKRYSDLKKLMNLLNAN